MTATNSLDRTQRSSVMLSVQIYCLGRSDPTQHRITNISETGACIAHNGVLSADSVVVVTVGQVDHVPADVKWVDGTLAGIAFHEPIDLARARMRRTAAHVALPPRAGWLDALNDAYRK